MEKCMVLICEEEDITSGVLKSLKPFLGDMPTKILQKCPEYMIQFDQYCEARGITCALVSNEKFLKLHIKDNPNPKLSEYAGSHYYYKLRSGREIEIVYSNPMMQLHTVPYGKFMIERWAAKLVQPKRWFPTPAFSWKEVTPSNFEEMLYSFDDAFIVGVDIETVKEYLRITMISYTTVHLTDDGKYRTTSWVLQIKTLEDLQMMRMANEHPCAKVLQNGKYDALYCARWMAPLVNYIWDTKLMQFCWLAELPKDLAFLQALYVRTAAYWKHLSESGDLMTKMEYNARDTWGTVVTFMAMVFEMPDFVNENYTKKIQCFPPSHFCELLGVKKDEKVQQQEYDDMEKSIEARIAHFHKSLGKPLNTNSPPQMKSLLKVLGCGDLASTNEKDLMKASFRHPFNKYIIDQILEIRGERKLHSTYFPLEKNFHGRTLYALNPDGTDTGRNASKESAFWCGLQIQNVPGNAKASFVADDGFYIAECDLEQAESRGTGYFTGDTNLIDAVENSPDFHSHNASAFFGYKFEEIYDVKAGKVLMKPLRILSKRVNHGANYYMMEDTLVNTMGLEAIFEAKRLLNLIFTQPREIARYLLKQFERTYPTVRIDYPLWIKSHIKSTGMLVGPQGWTRICFGDPSASKPVLNSYIAHNPQSLNAMSVDESFVEVFIKIQLHPEHRNNFRLLAQIHDSIFFQYRKGHEYLCEMVRKIMVRPITCTDMGGITRTFLVPAALKLGKIDKDTGELIRATSWAVTE